MLDQTPTEEQLLGALRVIEAFQAKDPTERYSIFPIQDADSYAFWKRQEAMMWNSNEMDFSRDKHDYENLSPEKRNLLDAVLAFFSTTDGIVIDNIAMRFLLETPTMEAKSFYIFQMAIELVHAETYSLTINSIVPPERREKLFQAAKEMECVKRKNDWMMLHMLSGESAAERLLAFVFAEGVFFMSAFLYIFFFRQEGVLPNVIFSNEQISKDEGLHRDFGIMRYKREKPLEESKVEDLARSAVELELEFARQALPNPIGSLRPEDAEKYVKLLTDQILEECGHAPIWNIDVTSIPSWMTEISRTQKGNFYEVRIGNYSTSNIHRALDWRGRLSTTGGSDTFREPEKVDF